MDHDRSQRELDERTRRDLARLSDGSLQDAPRTELESRLAVSPALRAALDRQHAGAAALRGLDLEAPLSLRARLATERPHRPRRSPRMRLALGGALATTAGALVAIAVLVSSTGSRSPTVADAARLAERAPTADVAVSPSSPKLLAADVEGVPFPDWSRQFGWRQGGIRSDPLGDRRAKTVLYEHDGKRLAYTIVSGAGIAAPGGSTTTRRNGVTLHTFAEEGRRVVTWWRNGRTCVVSASGVSERKLLELASWRGDGAVPF